MKRTVFIILTLLSILSCKKSDEPSIAIKPSTDKIILNEAEFTGTTSVKLTWSKLDNDNFEEYNVQREVDTGPNQTTGGTLKRITDKNQTTYIDNDVPYKANVRYSIIGRLKPSVPMLIVSNVVTYSRPTANLLITDPYDVLINKADGFLYFIEREGKINLYDIAKDQVIKTINTVATLGYCDIADYNGKRELYVPRNDGWVFVYDAITLEKIAQINSGIKGSSVISRKNLLYISSDSNGSPLPLQVVSRVTGLKVSESSSNDLRRIKHIPNTETDMVAMHSGTSKSVYKFDQDGKFLGITYAPFSSNSINPDPKMIEFFQDGSKFLATPKGEILNKDLTYNTKIGVDLTFSTFGFSNDQSIIYAGTTKKTIESYSSAIGYGQLKSYTVSGVPIKVFDIGGTKLLCVSRLKEYNSDVWGIAIEKLNK